MKRFFLRCRISHISVLQINVVLLLAGLIFLMDVFNHMYVKNTLLRDATIVPGALLAWMFLTRFVTMLGYILNAILGIRMAQRKSLFKFAFYMLISFILLLYTLSIAASRLMYRSRFELTAKMMVLLLWRNHKLGKLEEEFGCCGEAGLIDYQISTEKRNWASGGCCGAQDCDGCLDKLIQYLWGIEMEVARDNFILFILLLIGAILMTCEVPRRSKRDRREAGGEKQGVI
ncbi:uncharacterized protein LOC117890996 [Drosophila subobscura]|uniref:uncharacterized protein LOC117890996 n=1 Tax=Drosophila subobscura TaxID=7241 RepID=UPI00155B248A|nr:uncharacterized protein LOC117890996 [Drosophila subobscura]